MQDQIPNFKDTLLQEGYFYVIELAGKDYYKIIDYHCPDVFRTDLFNKRMAEFLSFIDRNVIDINKCR